MYFTVIKFVLLNEYSIDLSVSQNRTNFSDILQLRWPDIIYVKFHLYLITRDGNCFS